MARRGVDLKSSIIFTAVVREGTLVSSLLKPDFPRFLILRWKFVFSGSISSSVHCSTSCIHPKSAGEKENNDFHSNDLNFELDISNYPYPKCKTENSPNHRGRMICLKLKEINYSPKSGYTCYRSKGRLSMGSQKGLQERPGQRVGGLFPPRNPQWKEHHEIGTFGSSLQF